MASEAMIERAAREEKAPVGGGPDFSTEGMSVKPRHALMMVRAALTVQRYAPDDFEELWAMLGLQEPGFYRPDRKY